MKYYHYNLRRKLIKALVRVMIDENKSLLESELIIKSVLSDAVDVVRKRNLEASGCTDEEGAEYHRAIIGEYCIYCGERVE